MKDAFQQLTVDQRKVLVRTWKRFADAWQTAFYANADHSYPPEYLRIPEYTMGIYHLFEVALAHRQRALYVQALTQLGINAVDVDPDDLWEMHPMNYIDLNAPRLLRLKEVSA